jgi:hypothetical protein
MYDDAAKPHANRCPVQDKEGSGTLTYDQTWHANLGTLVGGASWTDGVTGTALDLNGSQYVIIPDSPTLEQKDALTINAWVYWRNTTGMVSTIISKSYDAEYELAIGTDGSLVFREGSTNGSYASTSTNETFACAMNTWFMITVVRSSNGTISMYVNGQWVYTSFLTDRAGSSNNPVTIGCSSGKLNNFFTGKIDDLVVSASIWTQSMILETYINGINGFAYPTR